MEEALLVVLRWFGWLLFAHPFPLCGFSEYLYTHLALAAVRRHIRRPGLFEAHRTLILLDANAEFRFLLQ